MAKPESTADHVVVTAHEHVGALDVCRGGDAALDIGLGFGAAVVWLPDRIPRDLLVLCIGIEDRFGILYCDWPQQEACSVEGVR